MNLINDRSVAIIKSEANYYPSTPPFNPPHLFPEYPYSRKEVDQENFVYSSLREVFYHLNLDKENYNKKQWNPLGGLIKPDFTVLIKPNFIIDYHKKGGDIFCVITHGSILRAVIDYVLIALKGRGKIIVADAPIVEANFDKIVKLTGLEEILSWCEKNSQVEVSFFDIRKEKVKLKDGLIVERVQLNGDPKGYMAVDLGTDSEFVEISQYFEKYRGSDYDKNETIAHHNLDRNEYLISKSLLKADVVISVPKFKTHQKAGVTLNLKGMIGINGDKNWIPHFRLGNPSYHGDEFPQKGLFRSLDSQIKDKFKQKAFKLNKSGLFLASKLRKIQKSLVDHMGITKIRAGAWFGNDTLWRSILDLNKIVLYADKEGNMQELPQRGSFSVVDGIVGGEGDGPLSPRARAEGILIGGFNLLAVDLCATRLMGFDCNRILQYENALRMGKHKLMSFGSSEIQVFSNVSDFEKVLVDTQNRFLNFSPSEGWIAISK
jgi:uncharacterized protein (DUF362 family)